MSDRSTRQSQSRAEQLRVQRQQASRVVVVPTKKEVPAPAKHQVVNPFGRSAVQTPIQQPVKKASVITSRSTPYSTPLRESVSSPARRKAYHVAANGVETRLPSLPRLHFSWQWISGLMVIVTLAAVLLMLTLDVFKVTQVQVDGLERVQVADILPIVQLNAQNVFTVDRQKVLTAVSLAFPELTDISLTMDLSGVLHLAATERTPVLAWINEGNPYWFDASGVLMSPRGEVGSLLTINSTGGVPLTKTSKSIHSAVDFANLVLTRKEDPLTPEDVINNLDPKVMKAAMELSKIMPTDAVLVYDSISGMGWQDLRGWKVYFGIDLDDIQFKQVEYQTIIDHLTKIGITPTEISVAHTDFPYYRTN